MIWWFLAYWWVLGFASGGLWGLVLWVLAGLRWGFWWGSGCFGLLVMVCDAGGFRERFLVVDFGFGVLVFAFVGDLVLPGLFGSA